MQGHQKSTIQLFSFLDIINRTLCLWYHEWNRIRLKTTLWPSSQSWTMLNRSCFNPSIWRTLLMWGEELARIPSLHILPFLMSSYVTLPPSILVSDAKWEMFSVMCLEHPLLRYHLLLLGLALRDITEQRAPGTVLGTHIFLVSFVVSFTKWTRVILMIIFSTKK